MFGREELESLDSNIFYVGEDLYLVADKVYEVMDAMENRIKELEAENEKLKSDLKIVRIIFDE